MTSRAVRVLWNLASPAIVSDSRPLLLQARELQAVELHAGDGGEHAHEPLLDDLEAGQRLAELGCAAGCSCSAAS